MLMPKKQKYRKHHRPKTSGIASRRNELAFGSYGIRSLSLKWVSSRQIEAARRAMTRYIKRGGKSWIRIFPDSAITEKGGEVGMGNGKGGVDHYVSVVKPGTILIEMDGVDMPTAKEALRLAAMKLPVKTKFIMKEHRGPSHETR